MSPATQGLVVIVATLAVFVTGTPIAFGLGAVAVIFLVLFQGLDSLGVAAETLYSGLHDFTLVSIPMFIMMGAAIGSSPAGRDLYLALDRWLYRVPGGLVVSNLGACALFAALTGSSPATCAAIGKMGIPEMRKRGYPDEIATGSICAGGTLGILIPPSINMIVYGVLTETSIPKLYLAGIIPGLVLAGMFSLTVLLFCLWRPEWGGKRTVASWDARIKALPDLVPPLVIFLAVIGSIYAGWATATESAALGVLAALGVAAWNRRLTLRALLQAFEGTMRTTAMIMAILVAAYFLNFVITSIGLTTQVNRFITSLGLSPTELLVAVIVFYVILGMFMETLSMMVATVPIIAPIMFQAGYDPIWFGILVILLMETAMITPPVGINLYVVQGLRKRGRIDDVIIGTLPFVVTLVLMMVVLSVFPDLALVLPRAAAN